MGIIINELKYMENIKIHRKVSKMGSTFVSENKVSISGFLEKSVHFSVFGKKCPFLGYASFCPFYVHYPRNIQKWLNIPTLSNMVFIGTQREWRAFTGFWHSFSTWSILGCFGSFWSILGHFGALFLGLFWSIFPIGTVWNGLFGLFYHFTT